MNYFEGNEFFLLLSVVLLIGFVVNFFEKRKDYYILALSLICRSYLWQESSDDSLFTCLYRLPIFSSISCTEDRSKATETTGFSFYSSFGDQ